MMLPFRFWNPTGDLACPSQLEATSGKESESESARRARALEQAAGVAPSPGAGAGTFELEARGRPHWQACQPQWPESLPIMIPLEPATSESVRVGHCGGIAGRHDPSLPVACTLAGTPRRSRRGVGSRCPGPRRAAAGSCAGGRT
jgi:hypothetical protein